jgi:Uma2 family endonuclease
VAIASANQIAIPERVLAGLHRAGMPAAEIARVYALPPEAVARALAGATEPLRLSDMELLRDDDHRYELWDGELWRMSPTKKRHGRGTTRAALKLGRYLEAHPLGALYIGEVGFRVGPRARLVCPDVAYVSHERDAPVGDDEFFPYAPDLAIEVLSPDNTLPKVRRKARAYLASGARLVWAVDPRRQTVTVYRPGAEPQMLRGEDLLSGEEVLPGFAVRVADLF